jgi:hypothetical protein
MRPQSDDQVSGPEWMSPVQDLCPGTDLALSLLSIVSNPFRLYHYYVNGISAEELAAVFNLPVSWVQQRIEAVRLCVEHQIVFTFETTPDPSVDEGFNSRIDMPFLRTSAL